MSKVSSVAWHCTLQCFKEEVVSIQLMVFCFKLTGTVKHEKGPQLCNLSVQYIINMLNVALRNVMFVGVLPQKVHWRDPNLVITIPMIMTALKGSGLFQFSLLTVIVITFKFSLQTVFMMPEQRATLYDSVNSGYTQHFRDIYFFVWWIICTGHSQAPVES